MCIRDRLYAQALELLYHNERYWFDSEEEAIMTENKMCIRDRTTAVMRMATGLKQRISKIMLILARGSVVY